MDAIDRAPSGAVPRAKVRSRWIPARRVLAEAMLIFVAVEAYRFVRIVTAGQHRGAIRNGVGILRLEERLALDLELGAQSLVLGRRSVIEAFNTIYAFGFWSTVAAALLILFLADHVRFRQYRNALFLSGAVGLVVFATFPVAPPRMLDGFVDTVHQYSSVGGIAHPGNFTNEYAAMPSFHVGWLVLAGAAIAPLTSRWYWRVLLFVPATLMTITVVVTANHYLLDAVAGAVISVGALFVAKRIPMVGDVITAIGERLEPHGGWTAVLTKAGLAIGVAVLPFVGARAMLAAKALERSSNGGERPGGS
jgi:hypothetical protein